MPAQFPYQVLSIVPLSRQVTQLNLCAASQFIPYQAGQYIQVTHADNTQSPLSIACAPLQLDEIELHLSHSPKNLQAQDVLRTAYEEQTLWLNGPYGICTAHRLLSPMPVLFYVRGTGFAPAKAVLDEWRSQQEAKQVSIDLVWSAGEQDFYLLNHIEKWSDYFENFTFTKVVAEKSDLSAQQTVLKNHPHLSEMQVYASGPYEWVQKGFIAFVQHGLKPENFHSDMK